MEWSNDLYFSSFLHDNKCASKDKSRWHRSLGGPNYTNKALGGKPVTQADKMRAANYPLRKHTEFASQTRKETSLKKVDTGSFSCIREASES